MFQNNYFKSKVFKRLFFSYLIIISLCFCIYSVMAIYETAVLNKERKNAYYEVMAKEISRFWDDQLSTAKTITSRLNSNTYIKKMCMDVGSENEYTDSYTAYQVKNAITTAKTSSRNLDVTEVMLFLNDSKRVNASSGIVWMKEPFENTLEQGSIIKKDSVKNLLHINDIEILTFTKEYLIFCEDYTYQTNLLSRSKGLICVLFDYEGLMDDLESIMNESTSFRLILNNKTIFGTSDVTGITIQQNSKVNYGVTYELIIDENEFDFTGNLGLTLMILLGFSGCILFAILAYYFANKYYLPIGSIEKIMNNEMENDEKDELDNIIKGIEGLIGERNGYREKMITIAPYAEQGMLHGILTGNVQDEKLSVLWQEEYIDLKRPYFSISVFNIAYVGTDYIKSNELANIANLIQSTCKIFYTEEMQVYCYIKDMNHIYMVVNSDTADLKDELFYQIHEKVVSIVDNKDYVITMGVDQVRDDISLLQEACNNAIKALDGMLVGGRGSVYFYEEENTEGKQEYYFPKDFVKRLDKILREQNLVEAKQLLDEIYEKNMADYDCSVTAIQCLIDELHISTLKVLKGINSHNITHINIDKIKFASTLEESFQYYYAVYETICNQLQLITNDKKDVEKLGKEIIEYIDENYRNPDISLATITEKFGVSNKYITQCCKQNLGVTYLQYIQEKRIAYSKRLLDEGKLSLEQIAELCGYSNLLTFRRNFKSITGMNPSDYRNE